MRNKILFFLLSIFVGFSASTQTVYTDPALPTADEAVTVYFNATGTPLEGYSGSLYTHTGVTVNGSKWQYVIGDWGNNTNQPQLTSLGNNLYELDITPTIRDFYGVPAMDSITEMDFVFRSADNSLQTSPDIFIDVYELGLNISIVYPDMDPFFVNPGETINFSATATEALNVSLYVDDLLITTVTGNSLTYPITSSSDIDSKHWIKVVASGELLTVADSIYYYVRGVTEVAALPPGVVDGINYIDDQTVTLVLYAPYKNSVFAFGDFSNWEIGAEYKFKRTTSDPQSTDTRYWLTITGLQAGTEYAFQYLIDENLVIAEPYTDKVLDPWNDSYIDQSTYPNLKPYPAGKTNGIVSVLETGQQPYNWQVENFTPPDENNMVVYEMLIRDFVAAHDYQTLIDTLSYFKQLGINAIELMPIMEFEGNLSWGYNPSFYFAPDKYYGTKDKLKEFIDVCHENGIAVILDIAMNDAFGQCPLVQMYFDQNSGEPSAENPWFNEVATHPFNVGYDFNHESPATKYFVKRVHSYWLTEFKVDGFRLDLSKGYTQNVTTDVSVWGQYDASRIAILEDYADHIWSVNPSAYMILEHFAENSEEKVLSAYGMMLWGNLNCNYNQSTMGYPSGPCSWDFSGISYQQRSWSDPHLVGYMESHDEERLMAKNTYYGNSSGDYNIKDTTIALQRIEQAACLFIPVPGPKMIWQFGELGYDYCINYPGAIGGSDHRLDNKPIRWDYENDYRRKVLFRVFSTLIHLKNTYNVFQTTDYSMNVSSAMKTVHLNDNSMNVTILGNFDVTPGNISPDFQHTGYWYDYFAGDSIMIDDVTANLNFMPGEFRLYTDVKLEKPEIGLGTSAEYFSDESNVLLFPNPVHNRFTIALNLEKRSDVVISLFGIDGKKLKTLANSNLGQGSQKLTFMTTMDDGSSLNPGFYLCEVTVNGKREILKLLIQ